MEDSHATDSRYTVKSVARAAMLLEYLESATRHEGASLTELADRLGISKSSTLAQLQTLRDFGLVSESTTSGAPRYRLGLALVRLGHSAAQNTAVAEHCRGTVEELSEQTGLAARVAVLDRDGWAIPVLRAMPARVNVSLDLRMGEKEWPHRSGIGKALMSMLSDEEVEVIVRRLGMPAATKNTLTSIDDLLKELERTRADGYCLDDEEDADGIMCVAAPVPEPDGRPFAAVSVTGVRTDDLLHRLPEIADAVRDRAAALATSLRPRTQTSP